MKKKRLGLDMDKIAKRLGAKRRGSVSSGGGYFGAQQTLVDVSVLKEKQRKSKKKKKN